MGDTWMDRFSDAGSIPARSIYQLCGEQLFVLCFIRNVRLVSEDNRMIDDVNEKGA